MNEYPGPQKNISLMDLIFYCLEKWRWIVVCMLLTAIVAGIYKYQETVEDNQRMQNNEIMGDKESYQPEKYYEHAIEEIQKELEIQEDYLKSSVVMQMDPYHISTGTLSYFLEGNEHMSSVIAAYSAFVSDGKMAKELYSTNNEIPVEDLRYLVSFVNSTNEVYSLNNSGNVIYRDGDSIGSGSAVFQIQIRMPDGKQGEVYLKRAKEIMAEYTSQLQTEVAEHKLTLLSSIQSEMTDSDMQDYQSNVRLAYTTSVRNLQTLQTEMKTLQGTQGTQISMPTLNNPVSSAIRFALFGLALGVFLSCFVLLVVYMLGGKLQDIEEFKTEFGMPLLGIVRISGNKRKLFAFIDTWVFHLRGGIYAKINFEEQVKIAAANIRTSITGSFQDNEVKIMLSGTISEKDAAVLCTRLASEIPQVSLSSYKQIIFQSSSLRELEDYDGILFFEKRGVSDSAFILQEKKLALDRNVKVLGTVVLC